MKQLVAFTKKELLEQVRGGRFIIFGILFCLFGIMNPATAKLLPWLLEIMSEQFAENSMMITGVEVDALTSWEQFFKNMPILLLVFIVMFSGILTLEYQKGTLINVITKGLKRWKILAAKLLIMLVVWTGGYFITFGITYGYNAYFWDNGIAQSLFFAAFGYYLVGLWLISIVLFASVVLKSASSVILLVGGEVVASYLLSLLPVLQKYVPTFLLSANELLSGAIDRQQYLAAVGISVVLIIFNGILAVLLFNNTSL